MASILCLETSTEVCSVALATGGTIVEEREDKSGKNHALLLTCFAEEVMKAQNRHFQQLDAVAVSGGPGSYTGLRIGVSTAKGLCYAAGLPLIAIPSLEAMAHHVIRNMQPIGTVKNELLYYCPMIDARRMEVYAAIYDQNMQLIRNIQADIIDHLSFSEFMVNRKMLFFGNGADKCKSSIQHPNALFLDNITTSASHMAELAETAYQNERFVDVAYYEPFYLKDFVATVPTKNIFHSNSLGVQNDY
ncbi:MAG: tRNA (adenosine(37)-N6)-threonylcarbamoyltransferase complex dimerization subunit type 1 TsaB [Prolixibacteraceae bacterium]|jgi:tRNA threonylcarbamoyladenosine biosynthesis protein TsaB|nr:tRNA (adenosine(37)-N6)-threonylcarbamoyltransferase complex dimerization subunit type 1 TsaB [Prolixibacteraceae bacterium]